MPIRFAVVLSTLVLGASLPACATPKCTSVNVPGPDSAAPAVADVKTGPTTAPTEPGAPLPQAVDAAPDPELQIANLGTCRLDSGETIQDCRVGYRTFGTLNPLRTNAVLFPTWFTGTTKHLATRVPEKMVDTKKFFLVLIDALGNGVSSSPSNSPKQPRLAFPRFTVHDMVESQRRVLREVLGVPKLHTVIGTSMGGMQSFEWAVAHPDEVDHIVTIVGSPQLSAQDLLLWNAELHILDDSATYAKGEYRGRPKIPALQEVHWMMLATPDQRNSETSRSAYEGWVRPKADDVAFDWNDWHRQLEAMIGHDVARADKGDLAAAAKRVKAKALVIVGNRDLMVNAGTAKIFAKAMGSAATLMAFDDACGHGLQGCEPQLPDTIRAFMSR